jgi:hypothetical protein
MTWRAIKLMQRRQRHCRRADLVGERRDREVDPFAAVALALAVERLVLTELLKHHHGQQVRPDEACAASHGRAPAAA